MNRLRALDSPSIKLYWAKKSVLHSVSALSKADILLSDAARFAYRILTVCADLCASPTITAAEEIDLDGEIAAIDDRDSHDDVEYAAGRYVELLHPIISHAASLIECDALNAALSRVRSALYQHTRNFLALDPKFNSLCLAHSFYDEIRAIRNKDSDQAIVYARSLYSLIECSQRGKTECLTAVDPVISAALLDDDDYEAGSAGFVPVVMQTSEAEMRAMAVSDAQHRSKRREQLSRDIPQNYVHLSLLQNKIDRYSVGEEHVGKSVEIATNGNIVQLTWSKEESPV